MLFTATGTLRYSKNPDNYWLVVDCDQEISNYYRSLIPKYYYAQPQKHKAHITVVRSGKEMPVNLQHWRKYEGEQVEYLYDSEVKMGQVYFWLNTFCERLEEIRIELGMTISSEYILPPNCPFAKCFHMTIGNRKSQSEVT